MGAREEFYYRKLLKWANGEDVPLLLDLPWANIPKIVPGSSSDTLNKPIIIEYLNGLSTGDDGAVPLAINAINCAGLSWGVIEGPDGCAQPKVFVNNWGDILWTLLYVGLSVPYKSKDGLPIATYTRKCQHCQRFFLSKTRKWSCYCNRQCRDAEKYKRSRTSRRLNGGKISSA
jgi:hypothetical protein